MAITSQLRASPLPGDVLLRDWQGAGLLKPSAVRPVFATLEQALIIRRLGVLGIVDQQAVKDALAKTVG